MSVRCLQTALWLERRQSGLSVAKRLQLEEHLADCVNCRQQAEWLDALRALIESSPEVIPTRARTRLIHNAMSRARSSMQTASGPRIASPYLAWGGGVALVAAAVTLVWNQGQHAPLARHDAIDQGSLTRMQQRPPMRATPAQSGATLPVLAEQNVKATPDRALKFGAATVHVEREAALRWHPETASLYLGDAHCDVNVESTINRSPMRVFATNYGVQVLAAHFELDSHVVVVLAGELQVVSLAGGVLAERLVAGQTWSPTSAEAVPVHSRGGRAHVPQSAAADLREARALLAKRAVDASQRAIGSALRAHPTRSQRAEAQSLLAECALVAGRATDAQSLYTEVAERYRDLDAGDNALFAAARLAQQAADPTQARALLQRYLARYPHGRFRADAERRLAATKPE